MKRYRKYVYYIRLDNYYNRRLNLNILNLETNNITLLIPRIQLRKRLGINFLRGIEGIATNPNVPKTETIRLFNEDINYKKLVKKIKNYKRDWWKGDLEKTIRKLKGGVIFIGGV